MKRVRNAECGMRIGRAAGCFPKAFGMDAGCWMLVVMLMSLPLWGQKVAVRGETVYTMAGAPLADGVVLIRDGKIEKEGKAAKEKIENDYTVLSRKVVTPGLIDAHTVVGLAGYYNQPHDQDQLDKSSPIQPELRALDAYNPREKLVEWLRGLGVTTLHTGQAPGALASGQSILVKTVGNTVEEVLLDSAAMVTLTLGSAVSRNYKSPGTSAKARRAMSSSESASPWSATTQSARSTRSARWARQTVESQSKPGIRSRVCRPATGMPTDKLSRLLVKLGARAFDDLGPFGFLGHRETRELFGCARDHLRSGVRKLARDCRRLEDARHISSDLRGDGGPRPRPLGHGTTVALLPPAAPSAPEEER